MRILLIFLIVMMGTVFSGVISRPFIPYSARNLPVVDKENGFLGCFKDGPKRDMGSFPGKRGFDINSARAFCARQKTRYFALQDGDWAVCSNVFGHSSTYTKVNDTECGLKHTGGSYRNAVFLTSYKKASTAEL